MFKANDGYAGFSVKDIPEAKAFYTDVLGLEVEDDQMGLMINLPKQGKIFVYPKDDHEAATYTVLNLLVSDIDQAVNQLVEKGIIFEQYDFSDFKTDEKGIVWGMKSGDGPNIAWFKDPSGNIISIIEE